LTVHEVTKEDTKRLIVGDTNKTLEETLFSIAKELQETVLITKQNSETLKQIVEESRRDKEQFVSMIHELQTARIKCEMRFEQVEEIIDTRFGNKKEQIDKLAAGIKALEEDRLNLTRKIMWMMVGGLGSILVTVLTILFKMTGGHI